MNKELERCRAMLANTCEQGMKALEAAWKSITPQARQALKDELPALKASAEAYDQQREIADHGDESEMTAAATAALTTPVTNTNAEEGGDDDGNPFTE